MLKKDHIPLLWSLILNACVTRSMQSAAVRRYTKYTVNMDRLLGWDVQAKDREEISVELDLGSLLGNVLALWKNTETEETNRNGGSYSYPWIQLVRCSPPDQTTVR